MAAGVRIGFGPRLWLREFVWALGRPCGCGSVRLDQQKIMRPKKRAILKRKAEADVESVAWRLSEGQACGWANR